MKATYLDNNYYIISERSAVILSGGRKKLPKAGMEVLINLPGGKTAWLSQTPHKGILVWVIYPTYLPVGWKRNKDGSLSIQEKKE